MGVILETNVWGCMVRVLILKHEGDPTQVGQVSVYNSGSLEPVFSSDVRDLEPVV
jgi:hypothetical protein